MSTVNTKDFDIIAKSVYENLEQINRYLGKSRFVSKFHTNDPNAVDLPGVLSALAKEDETRLNHVQCELESSERPTEDEIDALFDTIRGKTSTNKPVQRQGSLKRPTSGMPLQQSRIMNETNLAGNGTLLTGSASDLTGIINKTSAAHPKSPPVEVEVLVSRLREAIDALERIENRTIEPVDLVENRNYFRREWANLEKSCERVETILDECKQQLESNEGGAIKRELLISNEFIKSLKKLQTVLHDTVYIKKTENPPDLSKTLGKDMFPLSECLEAIEEKIRQKQL